MQICKAFLLKKSMPTDWILFLMPFIFACIGWIVAQVAISVYISVILNKKNQLAQAIGNYAVQQFSIDAIEKQLTHPDTIEKILPFAEEHIDSFLRVKLPAAMPMLAMFISDKLVAEMKAIFMNELKELFPALIGQYLANIKKDFNPADAISARLNGISAEILRPLLRKQLQIVSYACALTGFLCGCLYFFLTRLA